MNGAEHSRMRALQALLLAALLIGLSACGSTPRRELPVSAPEAGATDQGRRHVGLAIAAGMVGAPYRYGGDDPRGFDCSGLVFYAFREAGIDTPRTTRAQFEHGAPVSLARLEPGDLVFFELNGRKVSHVGIYAGNGRFVHAPSSGKEVSYAELADPYWQRRLSGARRLD